MGLIIFGGFVAINVSTTLGIIYGFFVLAYFGQVLSPRIQAIQIIAPRENIMLSLLAGVIFFAVWIFLSAYISGFFGTESLLDTASNFLIKLRSETQIPVLSNDSNIIFLLYGIAIPVIESLFFLSVTLIFWSMALRTPVGSIDNPKDRRFYKIIVIAILVGIVGSLFHASVRLLSDEALIIDFLFFSISAFGVLMSKRLFRTSQISMGAMVFFHIFVNSMVFLFGGG